MRSSDWSSDWCSSDLRHLLVKRARMEGFVIFDHMDRYGAALEQLRTWIAEGRLKWEEDILEGIETCPDAIAGLYRGENKGKRLIRLVRSEERRVGKESVSKCRSRLSPLH